MERVINLEETRILMYTDKAEPILPIDIPEEERIDFIEAYTFLTPKDILLNNVLIKNIDKVEVKNAKNGTKALFINTMTGYINESYVTNTFIRIYDSSEDPDVLIGQIDDVITTTYDESMYPIIRNDVKLNKGMVYGNIYLKSTHISQEIPIFTLQSKSLTDISHKINELSTMLIKNTSIFTKDYDYILYDNAIFKHNGNLSINMMLCDDMTSQSEPINNVELCYEELLNGTLGLVNKKDIVYINGRYYRDGALLDKALSEYLEDEIYYIYDNNPLVLRYLSLTKELFQYANEENEDVPEELLSEYKKIYEKLNNILSLSDKIDPTASLYISHKRNIIAISGDTLSEFDKFVNDTFYDK